MPVLLIEDDRMIGEAICAHLTGKGHRLLWAQTLAEARQAMEDGDIDALILDLQLPDGDGLDFLRSLRAQRLVMPVIVVSAMNDMNRRLDCLRAGADDYLAKPCHLQELALRLQGLLRRDARAAVIHLPENLDKTGPEREADAAAKPSPWARIRDFLRAHRSVFAVPVACALLLGLYLSYLQISGNFHTVIEGELYRSAQPTPAQLENYIKGHGIRTVVNLRGASDGEWYRQEIATTDRLNVRHIDFPMNSGRELTPEQADEIIALMKDAPKPILIHCKAGADRTGLVAALYGVRLGGMAELPAEVQLSVVYGHLALPYLSPTFAMDESWERLERYYGITRDAKLSSRTPQARRLL